MTISLYIRKAATPAVPKLVGGGNPNPVGRPAASPHIEYDYWNVQEEGGPPPPGWGGEMTDGGNYRRPKGSGGTPSLSQIDEKSKKKKPEDADSISDVEPVTEGPPPKPEDISDPLKNEDGTNYGEMPLEQSTDTGLGDAETVGSLRDTKQAKNAAEAEVAKVAPEEGQQPEEPATTAEPEAPLNATQARREPGVPSREAFNAAKKDQWAKYDEKNNLDPDRKAKNNEAKKEQFKDKTDAARKKFAEDRKQELISELSGKGERTPLNEAKAKSKEEWDAWGAAKKEATESNTQEVTDSEGTPVDEDTKQANKKAVKEKAAKADAARKKTTTSDIKSAKKDQETAAKAKDEAKKAKDFHTKKSSEIKIENNKLTTKNKGLQKKVAANKKKIKELEAKKKANPKANITPQIERLNEENKKHTTEVKRNNQKATDNHLKLKGFEKKAKDAEKAHSDAEKQAQSTAQTSKSEIPESPDQKLAHKQHTEAAKKKLETVEAHLENDPDNEDLWSLREIYAEQAGIEHVPGSEDAKASRRADSFAKEKGVDRHPDEIAAEKAEEDAKTAEKAKKTAEKVAKDSEKANKEAVKKDKDAKDPTNPQKDPNQAKEPRTTKETSKKRGSSIMTKYNQGAATGNKYGHFGTTRGGSEFIEGVKQVPKAGVSAGHFLLGDKKKESEKKPDDKKSEKKPLKPASEEDGNKVNKNMKLYIDIRKAGGTVTSAVDSDKSPEQNEEDYKESYGQRTSGAMGGDASPDRPGPGRKMNAVKSVRLYLGRIS